MGKPTNPDLLSAAIALRDDMLMRAEMNKWQNNGEIVVEAGNGVWFRFNSAIKKAQGHDPHGSTRLGKE